MLELKERLDRIRRNSSASVPIRNGEDRLRRWRETPALHDPSSWKCFLKAMGLSESEFGLVLGAAMQDYPESRSSPYWASEVIDLCCRPILNNASSARTDDEGYFALVGPLSNSYKGKLLSNIEAFNAAHDSKISAPDVIDSLGEGLDDELLALVHRTLILEANIARVSGMLSGETPRQRYIDFLEQLEANSVQRKLWRQYPGMARYANQLCRRWLAAASEFLARFAEDYVSLAEVFGDVSELCMARFQKGDAHNGGRRVIVAAFRDDLHVVYKPRPLAATAHFQALLDWLNQEGHDPPMRTLKVLDRRDYGWIEYVVASDCTSQTAVKRFYQRQGAMLALMYTIGGTDCHFENVIASGEHPILVDVETVFQPRLAYSSSRSAADDLSREALTDSVMASGLLPTPALVGGVLTDLSGLGAASFQETPLETIGIVDAGTDCVKVSRIPYRLQETSNRPALGGREANVHDHVADIELGFSTTYSLLRQRKEQLLDEDGPIYAFRRDHIRVLVRPTAMYASILNDSFHPNALYDVLVRERVLAQLWSESGSSQIVRAFAPQEYEQMLLGDIPYFHSAPDEDRIYSSDVEVAGFKVVKSGLGLATQRLRRMDAKDLSFQLSLIRATLSSLKAPREIEAPIRATRSAHGKPSALMVAKAIGDYFAATAITTAGFAAWLAPRSPDALPGLGVLSLPVGVVSTPLYDGLAGIALFLGYLGAATNHDPFQTLSYNALGTIAARLQDEHSSLGLGAFDGLGGLVYVYSHLGNLWQDGTLLRFAVELLPQIECRIERDNDLDLLSGAAGAILALLSLEAVLSGNGALELARRCGRRLKAAFETRSSQSGLMQGQRYNRGASHGYSGIALALSALSKALGYDELSLLPDVLKLESDLTAVGQWVDPGDPYRDCQATWCHGAPGIALCRLAALGRNSDSTQRIAVEAALLETLESLEQPLNQIGLCHGSLGVIESLFVASDVLPDGGRWDRLAIARIDALLESIGVEGWVVGELSGLEPLGLMTGLAGVGYAFLRFSRVAAIPSVLTLEPPRMSC